MAMKPEDADRILILRDGSPVTFSDEADRLKRIHDQSGGGYPLEILLSAENGVLLKKTFKNVWDRKGKVENLAVYDWDFPIELKRLERGNDYFAEILGAEAITIPESKNKDRQMTWDEMIED